VNVANEVRNYIVMFVFVLYYTVRAVSPKKSDPPLTVFVIISITSRNFDVSFYKKKSK